jgi:hypothetical protein
VHKSPHRYFRDFWIASVRELASSPAKLGLYYVQAVSHFDRESESRPCR